MWLLDKLVPLERVHRMLPAVRENMVYSGYALSCQYSLFALWLKIELLRGRVQRLKWHVERLLAVRLDNAARRQIGVIHYREHLEWH